MKSGVKNYHYFIERYIQCGEMPLYLLCCRDRAGQQNYCVMLCNFKKLKELIRMRRGFSDPSQFGRVLFAGIGDTPNELAREVLKAKYDFDIETPSSPLSVF